MSNKIEDVLGLGAIDTQRRIPGTTTTEGKGYRYVSCDSGADIATLFRQVVRAIDPPLAKNGGVVNEGCVVTLPSGDTYFAISYKGDIDGWTRQIEQGAAALGLIVATITEDSIIPGGGSGILLSECDVRFN